MTLYCQHTYRLRLQQGPGKPDIVSERPRNRRTELFLDGPAGTQIDIPDGLTGFDLGAALGINAIAALPCSEHPGEPKPAVATGGIVSAADAYLVGERGAELVVTNKPGGKGGSGG